MEELGHGRSGEGCPAKAGPFPCGFPAAGLAQEFQAGCSLSLKYTHISFGRQLSENCGDYPCGLLLDEGGLGKLVVAKSNKKKKEVNLWRND